MTWHFNVRLLSLVITLALTQVITNYSFWLALLIGLGFTHYALSFYYASARIRQLGTQNESAVPILSLAGLCALVYFLEFPLEVYFGLHHAFNEAYLKRRGGGESQLAEQLMASRRCLFYLAAYFLILRNDSHLTPIPQWLPWVFAVLSFAAYGLQARQLIQDKSNGSGWSDHSAEFGLIAVLVLSFFFKITFLQIVLYHFVLWTIMPVPQMKARGEGYLQQYVLLTAAGLLFYAGALVVFSPTEFSVALAVVLSQFYIWSYIHITASMALSSAHPKWIVNVFAPPATEATAGG